MNDSHHSDTKFFFGFFMGGLLGALIIFLLGTKEGKKVGRVLDRRGKDMVDDLEERIEELKEKGKDLIEQGEDMREQVLETLEEKKGVVGEAAVEKLEKALAHIEELQQKGVEKTATLRKKFRNVPKKK